MKYNYCHSCFMKINIFIFTALLYFIFNPNVQAANPNAPADFTIDSNVIITEPENFGLNMEVTSFLPWDQNTTIFNNYSQDSGFEPIVLRYKFSAIDGGVDYILGGADGTIGSDFTINSTIGDGFFNGAEVRIYRIVDNQVQLIRTDTVTEYFASVANGYRINLGSTGPVIQTGDSFVISLNTLNVAPETLGPAMNTANMEPWQSYMSWTSLQKEAHSVHAVTLPDNPGISCLRIDNTQNDVAVLGSIHFGPEPHFVTLDPGSTYEMSVWLRQEGLEDPWIFFGLEELYEDVNTVFTSVTNDWQLFTYTFTVPTFIPINGPLIPLIALFWGTGTVWVDNFQIRNTAEPSYAIRQEVMQDLMNFQPGPIRSFNGHTNEAFGTTLNNLTLPASITSRIWEEGFGSAAPNIFTLPEQLPLCRDTGSTPWTVISPAFSESEWLGLIEYLAAPYDPQTDTPESKPWAYRRFQQGQTAPWTSEFSSIRIEFSNEAWNPLYHPWTFTPTQYGQFAEYFYQVAQSSPYFTGDAADTIEFVLGGWTLAPQLSGHGHASAQQSPSSDYVAVSGYIGGWDSSLAFSHNVISDAGYQDLLLFTPGFYQYFTDQHEQTRQLQSANGVDYSLAFYEGGPGYNLPTPENLVNPVEEQYGKSLAAAVGTLDMMLYNETLNFGPQAFFRLTGGFNFSSHTPFGSNRRPHAIWLALLMRNQYANGGMVAVTTNTVPTTDIAPYIEDGFEEIPMQLDRPLISVYAYRDSATYNVFIISRKLNDNTPVTLHLPFQNAGQTTLYSLSGDPRSTNLDGNNIQIQETQLGSTTSIHNFQMPPGSVYLLSFQNTGN